MKAQASGFGWLSHRRRMLRLRDWRGRGWRRGEQSEDDGDGDECDDRAGDQSADNNSGHGGLEFASFTQCQSDREHSQDGGECGHHDGTEAADRGSLNE